METRTGSQFARHLEIERLVTPEVDLLDKIFRETNLSIAKLGK